MKERQKADLPLSFRYRVLHEQNFSVKFGFSCKRERERETLEGAKRTAAIL